MTTPTDQELEQVARELTEEISTLAFTKPMPLSFAFGKCEKLILSALKQVQPTKEEWKIVKEKHIDDDTRSGYGDGTEYEVERKVCPTCGTAFPLSATLRKDLVDSIAVSPQEKISADAQSVSTDVREASEDSSDRGNFVRLIEPAQEVVEWIAQDRSNNPYYQTDEVRKILARHKLRVPPPASTPANPPKEGRASAESENDWTNELRTKLENFIANATEEEWDQAFKDANFEIYRHSKPESGVPNIDTQRLDWLEKNPSRLQHCAWTNMLVGRCWDFQDHSATTVGECAVSMREAIDKAMASNNPPAEEEKE